MSVVLNEDIKIAESEGKTWGQSPWGRNRLRETCRFTEKAERISKKKGIPFRLFGFGFLLLLFSISLLNMP